MSLINRLKRKPVPHDSLKPEPSVAAKADPSAPKNTSKRRKMGSLRREPIGLYIDEHEITIARVSVGFRGPVLRSSQTIAYNQEDLNDVIGGLLAPIVGGRSAAHTQVAVGLPMMRVFFATRAILGNEKDGSPKGLLHELLKSSNVNVDDMEVDLIKAKPGAKALASLVSCRRKYLAILLSALGNAGIRPHRAEPAPFALLRLAEYKHKSPRKSKALIRVFLGPTQGVAILAAGTLPMVWRTFELSAGNEVASIRSAAKALQLVGRYRGEIPSPDAVFIHGRPDLTAVFADEAFRASLHLKSEHFPDPGFDAQSIAMGLASGCQPAEAGFDLFRMLKPPAPLWQVIPFGELAVQIALLLCVTLFLFWQSESVSMANRQAKAEAAKHAWMAKITDEKLEAEKKELTAKVDAIRDYLASRVLWNTYTRDMSLTLPEEIHLKSFTGQCDLEMGGKKSAKTKKSLVLQLSASMPEGGLMPREFDTYLNALRADTLLQKDFPLIELADLKFSKPGLGVTHASADFTVTCVPKSGDTKGASKPAAPEKAK